MAELEIIIPSLVAKLKIFTGDEANFPLGGEQQLRLLREELERLERFLLRDADEILRKSYSIESWEKQTTDFASAAEDVIDYYILYVKQWRNVHSTSINIDTMNDLDMLKKQAEEIYRRTRRILACRPLEVSERPHDSSSSRAELIAQSNILATGIVGFEEESAQIVNLLKDETGQLQVISIIGMGGLGKTTLAKLIYNNKDVSSHFDAQVWITVSKQYQATDIFRSALEQVMGIAYVEAQSRLDNVAMNSEMLVEELLKGLNEKRYLVIFDDVWDVQAWDQISAAFPNNQKQSRVILTTRNKEVAFHTDPSTRNHLELRPLDEKNSWKLFEKKAFADDYCPAELVFLGHKIAEKCRGLPLAIAVIGGLLMGKERTPNTWSKVLDHLYGELSEDTDVLRMSYINLPYYLKSCFLCLGRFPKDFEIDPNKLISLWVAKGFVQAREGETMEDVAEYYLDELIQRSMIQVSRRLHPGGPVQGCRVHELLRDLAISEARKDDFFDVHMNEKHSTSTIRSRRLVIHSTMPTGNIEQYRLPPPAPKISGTIEEFAQKLANEKIQQFSHEQLTVFTSDFKYNIGSGSFGDVYEGKFPDGVRVAVKVLKKGMEDVMKEQFMAEVGTMGRTYHQNLIKLYGFCFSVNMKAVVYEYMENGSLDEVLYENPIRIKWVTLYYIAIDIAKGISYLHESCNPQIVHLDIKPSNVLLDSNLSPKVTDFGLAKLNSDLSHFKMSRFRGTPCYAAPEVHFQHQVINCKCDVYSFGMMLFDILKRKRTSEGPQHFAQKIWESYKEEQLEKFIMDHGIGEEDKENAKRLSLVALLCVQFEAKNRPSMSTVVKMLEDEIQPRKPINPFPYNDTSN